MGSGSLRGSAACGLAVTLEMEGLQEAHPQSKE